MPEDESSGGGCRCSIKDSGDSSSSSAFDPLSKKFCGRLPVGFVRFLPSSASASAFLFLLFFTPILPFVGSRGGFPALVDCVFCDCAMCCVDFR